MFYPCLLLLLPHLVFLLTTGVTATPLPEAICPSCPALAQPSTALERRVDPPGGAESNILYEVFQIHSGNWDRFLTEARRLVALGLTPARVERVNRLIALAERAEDGQNQAIDEMRRLLESQNAVGRA
ncbi:hypothetical protein A4X06_0g2606 [Tilletia controversa]|uniref:Uncharacterized protein n=1 Tax=Tilletia controversa TaxID=13291 RepID=A0A8X7MW89_9BASI|nr:hypothetical protein CF328_g6774 [Tilletia controversa]KAE8251612.1 hypothetical protein A4X06_0g2606 [Tilletia controversa]